jgi:hypothetical protein
MCGTLMVRVSHAHHMNQPCAQREVCDIGGGVCAYTANLAHSYTTDHPLLPVAGW